MITIIEQAIDVLHRAEFNSAERAVALYTIKMTIPTVDRDALWQLMFQGPVYDGDVISKAARNRLLDWKLATRCCYKGEQGYTEIGRASCRERV